MTDFLPQIDPAKCTGCELCLIVCPNEVLALVNQFALVIKPEACEYSGACQDICPTEAISLPYEIVLHQRREEESMSKRSKKDL